MAPFPNTIIVPRQLPPFLTTQIIALPQTTYTTTFLLSTTIQPTPTSTPASNSNPQTTLAPAPIDNSPSSAVVGGIIIGVVFGLFFLIIFFYYCACYGEVRVRERDDGWTGSRHSHSHRSHRTRSDGTSDSSTSSEGTDATEEVRYVKVRGMAVPKRVVTRGVRRGSGVVYETTTRTRRTRRRGSGSRSSGRSGRRGSAKYVREPLFGFMGPRY